ncbi:helix-turn-helix domain-containing protein, partial [Escherichia coli]|nr:helix-turn-helix domain-containing protein [Escherichia coli]
MSTKLTGYVWDGCAASGMKLSSVAIMARLADFSNDEGVCWPSIETIARQIGAGMSTVRTAIARLEAEGWLTRKARRQGIPLFVFHDNAVLLEVSLWIYPHFPPDLHYFRRLQA